MTAPGLGQVRKGNERERERERERAGEREGMDSETERRRASGRYWKRRRARELLHHWTVDWGRELSACR
jgi:hypothetical protein